jgi:pimeloyl-ACP methyl ester carboxylesterase
VRPPLIVAVACAALFCRPAAAEVIAVAAADAALPTMTLYWPATQPRALLVYIPGGDGHIGLRAGQTDMANPFYLMLKQLTDSPNSRQDLDVVLFDSPERLASIQARAGRDHLSRIGAVLQFYRQKTGKPVWLMGHSNGALSVTEYVRYAIKLGQAHPVDGLIVSAPNKATFFDSTPLDFPVLFMLHSKDSCIGSDTSAAAASFRKVQGLDNARTAFTYIDSGSAEGKLPCASGYHMYNGAAPEVTGVLRDFIAPTAR